jgi:RND family efflux transporter MFP subunit
MAQGRQTLTATATLTAGLGLLVTVAGCQPGGDAGAAKASTSAAKPAPPAKVEGKVKKEAELSTVTLAPDAETHLGLALAEVGRKAVPRTATYAGEVTIPPGRQITVASPFVGTLKAPPGGNSLLPGAPVKAGQIVFVLVPDLTPESHAQFETQLTDAREQVKQFTDQLAIARTQLDRMETAVGQKLVPPAQLVDAKLAHQLAQTNLKAAEARREALVKATSGSASDQPVVAPASGVIQNVTAQEGQQVGANAPLFTVMSLDPVWVKVPVYVGDASRLAGDRPASIGGLADAPGQGERPGRPVPAPPSADPIAAVVHVFYEVDNKDSALRPGERVGVTLPLRGDDTSLVVPRASVVRDIDGGAWVYVKTSDHAYSRKRVLVERVVGGLAVLVYGPKAGDKVVTDGAMELFGTEFGGGK